MHFILENEEEEWKGRESKYLKSSVKFPQSVMIGGAKSSGGIGPPNWFADNNITLLILGNTPIF